jgi:hypothetical protein
VGISKVMFAQVGLLVVYEFKTSKVGEKSVHVSIQNNNRTVLNKTVDI